MTSSEWMTGPDVWDRFVKEHPELGFRAGRWPFHNFLRFHRQTLIDHDAIRLARKRFWIGHVTRFVEVAFDCATGAGKQSLAEAR